MRDDRNSSEGDGSNHVWKKVCSEVIVCYEPLVNDKIPMQIVGSLELDNYVAY